MNSNPFSASLELADISALPMVYADMERQFPSEEMSKYEHMVQWINNNKYKILLYKRNADQKLLGYALVYSIEESNMLWLDYLAILPAFQSQGCGSRLFEAIHQKYCGPYDGIMFSVEHVSQDNPELAKRQQSRIRFYKRLGAYPLQAGFLLPFERGSLPMYLFIKPSHTTTNISRQQQIEVITNVYEYCYANLEHRRQLLPLFQQTIVDESFPQQ